MTNLTLILAIVTAVAMIAACLPLERWLGCRPATPSQSITQMNAVAAENERQRKKYDQQWEKRRRHVLRIIELNLEIRAAHRRHHLAQRFHNFKRRA